MFKEHEFLYEINDTEAKAIVVLDHLFPIVQAVKDQTGLEDGHGHPFFRLSSPRAHHSRTGHPPGNRDRIAPGPWI